MYVCVYIHYIYKGYGRVDALYIYLYIELYVDMSKGMQTTGPALLLFSQSHTTMGSWNCCSGECVPDFQSTKDVELVVHPFNQPIPWMPELDASWSDPRPLLNLSQDGGSSIDSTRIGVLDLTKDLMK